MKILILLTGRLDLTGARLHYSFPSW